MLNIVWCNFKSQFFYLQCFIVLLCIVGILVFFLFWLCQVMLNQVDWKKSFNIVELGVVDGVLIKCILLYMLESLCLQVYEIQFYFVYFLYQINDF